MVHSETRRRQSLQPKALVSRALCCLMQGWGNIHLTSLTSLHPGHSRCLCDAVCLSRPRGTSGEGQIYSHRSLDTHLGAERSGGGYFWSKPGSCSCPWRVLKYATAPGEAVTKAPSSQAGHMGHDRSNVHILSMTECVSCACVCVYVLSNLIMLFVCFAWLYCMCVSRLS